MLIPTVPVPFLASGVCSSLWRVRSSICLSSCLILIFLPSFHSFFAGLGCVCAQLGISIVLNSVSAGMDMAYVFSDYSSYIFL